MIAIAIDLFGPQMAVVQPPPDFYPPDGLSTNGTGNWLLNGALAPISVSSGIVSVINDASIRVNKITTDVTLSGDSDTTIATEHAVKEYVDHAIPLGSMIADAVLVTDHTTHVVTNTRFGADSTTTDESSLTIRSPDTTQTLSIGTNQTSLDTWISASGELTLGGTAHSILRLCKNALNLAEPGIMLIGAGNYTTMSMSGNDLYVRSPVVNKVYVGSNTQLWLERAFGASAFGGGALCVQGGISTGDGNSFGGMNYFRDTTKGYDSTHGCIVASGGVAVNNRLYVTGATSLYEPCAIIENNRPTGDSIYVAMTILAPNMAAGSLVQSQIGRALSAGNSGSMYFYYNGSNDPANHLGFSTYGQTDTLGVYADRVAVTPNTVSTTKLTGALVVAGGLGVNGEINCATMALEDNTAAKVTFSSANGDLTIDAAGNDINIHSTDTVRILNTTESNSPTSGALVVSGGAAVNGRMYITGNPNVAFSPVALLTNTRYVVGEQYYIGLSQFNPNMAAGDWMYTEIGKQTGNGQCAQLSFVYAGVDNINNNLNIALYGYGGIAVYKDRVRVNDTLASTSKTTGALTVAGGVGIEGALNVGSPSTVMTATAPQFTIARTPAQYITFSIDNAGDAIVDCSGNDFNFHSSDRVHVTNPTTSTSTTTGALLVDGGVGIVGNVHIGGTLTLPILLKYLDGFSSLSVDFGVPGGVAATKTLFLGNAPVWSFAAGAGSMVTGTFILPSWWVPGTIIVPFAMISKTSASTGGIDMTMDAAFMTNGATYTLPAVNSLYVNSAVMTNAIPHEIVGSAFSVGVTSALTYPCTIGFRFYRSASSGLDTYPGAVYLHNVGLKINSRQIV